MDGFFDSTTDEQTTDDAGTSDDLHISDTSEAPAESETAKKTGDEAADSSEQPAPTLNKVPFNYGDKSYELELPAEIADLAKNGLLMQADYTKGKQELKDQVKALEARGKEIDSALEAMRSSIEYEKEFLNSTEMQELKEDYPGEYQRQYDMVKGKIDKFNDYQAARSQEAEALHNQKVSNEIARYSETIPEWLDETEKDKDFKMMGKFVEEQGFTKEEIENLYPAKTMKILRMAAKYNAAKSSVKSKEKSEAAKSSTPGTSEKNTGGQSFEQLLAAQMK